MQLSTSEIFGGDHGNKSPSTSAVCSPSCAGTRRLGHLGTSENLRGFPGIRMVPPAGKSRSTKYRRDSSWGQRTTSSRGLHRRSGEIVLLEKSGDFPFAPGGRPTAECRLAEVARQFFSAAAEAARSPRPGRLTASRPGWPGRGRSRLPCCCHSGRSGFGPDPDAGAYA